MLKTDPTPDLPKPVAGTPEGLTEFRRQEALLKTGALQNAILNSANFSSIATDERGVIQIFNIGAERMLGYAAADVLNKITPADISDPQELILRATELSVELETAIAPGFEALVFKASRGIEDIYELTYIRKDGSRFPAIVSVTALRNARGAVIGYLLIGTDNTARKQVEAERRHLLEEQERTNQQLQQANQTLRESEEKFAVTLHSIGDAVIATDAAARVTLLNPLAERLTGWTQAQASGRPVDEIFKIINKETRLNANVPVAETLAHGTVQGLATHTVVIARDGSECDIADSCAPIRDRDGKVIGAVLVFRDVTEEYAAQQALRDSTALIQTILNTVADGIITIYARGGMIKTVNPAAERMFGYSGIELVGQNFSLLIPELDQDQRNGSLEYYSASDEARAVGLGREVLGRRQDGRVFPMEMAVSEMWLGGERYFTGILRDTTARKQAEEALLQAGALQSAIFNSANFSSIATDAKGVIQIFNVGAERMLGYTAAEVMNKVTPADISDSKEVIARAKELSLELGTQIEPGFEALVFKASRGIEDIYELTYIRKDGSRFPAVVSVTALRDDQNNIIGYLLIGTDNTARKQAEEALLKAGALQKAIFDSANFSSIATDAKGVIQIFNVGAERMLGYTALEVMNKITPADISDPQEVIERAQALSLELDTPITPGFEALVFKASRGIEDIYELTYIRKDGSRFPAVVSVTALRDDENTIIGYLLIGTDNTARKQAEEALLKAGALQKAIFDSANFSSIATDAKGVIQIFNVGAERMLGYTAAEVMNKITPADISDPQEVIARAKALSAELGTPITPGFEALVFKASRGIEDIYELTYIRKDGSRFPAVVSVTALRDAHDVIIGYLLIGTDNTARKRAEEALLKAGALQSAIFNSANFSSIATDAKGVIQIFNVGAERMLGYAAADVMNKITPAEISDPQEVITRAKALSAEAGTTIRPGFEALVFKASRGIEDIYELTYIRKDGSRFPAMVSVTALRDDKDAIIGYLLIGTDNTARKRAEEALLKAGALQNAIFNSANFSSIATDAHGVIQIFNVGAERMLGYEASTVINKITPAGISDAQELLARAETLSLEFDTLITPGFEALVFKASRGIEDIYELTYIRKDGSRFPAVVSVTALRDAQGVIIGYLLIGTDNTARKQAEEALLQAGALQSAIFNSAVFASVATDAKGVIQIFNVGAERMLGYTALEVMNKITPADISDPQEVIARAKALSAELRTQIEPGFEALVFKAARGIEDIYELTYIRKDGSRFPAVVSVTALRDAQNAIIGYLLIGTDNTARKQAIELEYANRMKSEFLANMSHELRTPLNGIIGFTEFLIDEKPGPLRPKQKEYLGDVLNSARHLLQLINDVLDLAKVEAGKMELYPETFPVRKAVEEVTAVIKSIAQKKHIAVGIEVSDGLDAVTLDQHKFKQVLYNLLSNAVKFTDDGGQVDIHARRLDPHRLEVQVRDTGIGIKAEDINRLFIEFEQLDSGTARRFEGTGLGLALTKKIVEFQGGRIGVQSESSKGSVFTVDLPMMVGKETV